MNATYSSPPEINNHCGNPRRFGLEIEFGTVRVQEAADLIQSLFGGTLSAESPHRTYVKDTPLGDFLVELDFGFVHPKDKHSQNPPFADLQKSLRHIVGELSQAIVPSEIVCPPVTFDDIPKIHQLVNALAEIGASGTSDNPLYGFGFQINPEIARADSDYITRIFKAHLLLSDWLRAVIKLDFTRQMIAFADPFDRSYIRKVVHPDYWPDLTTLMEDYLKANPTRNREMDLLPLFSWLDGALVRHYIQDERIKARPTFHYRLPNADLSSPDWSLNREWNRWCVVERLGANKPLLDAMGADYLVNDQKFLADDWAIKASEWLLT